MAKLNIKLYWNTIKGGNGYPIYAQLDLVAFACDEHDRCVDFVFLKNSSNEYMTYTKLGGNVEYLEIDTENIPGRVKNILFVAIINQNAGYADFSVIKKCSLIIKKNDNFCFEYTVKKRHFNNNNNSLILAKLCNFKKQWSFEEFDEIGSRSTFKDWIKILGAGDTEAFNNILSFDDKLNLKSISSKILFPTDDNGAKSDIKL